MKCLIGRKLGMTQFFDEEGMHVPVTVIQAGPCPVLQVKTKENDGYNALQIGYGEKREKLMNRPLKGHIKNSGVKSVRIIKEMRLDSAQPYKPGDTLDVDIFEQGGYVDVAGTTIGKGFQGGVKRWHWAGGKASHGSMHHRQVGSVGASSFPSRIVKGHHMPGRMGGVTRTVQNLEVVKIDKANHIIAVKGSVPGNENSFLLIKESVKKHSMKKKKPEVLKEPAKEPKKAEKKKETKPKDEGQKKK